MVERPVKVRLVEDDPGDADLLRMMLSAGASTAFSLESADCLAQALPHLAAWNIDIILLDLSLPEGISFLAAIRDTTERHRMQARVVQAEKMASLGLLSAGVAHEINNPLAFVANNLAVLDRDIRGLRSLLDAYAEALPEIETARPERAKKIAQVTEEIDLTYLNQNLERILQSTRQGVKRVADIVQNLRGFVRTDQAAVDRVDIHAAIHSSLDMIQSQIRRRHITIEKHLGDVPPIYCSPSQINQVFLNLLANALHAIEATRKPTGRIEINTRAQDNHVIVEIADDGCGIPPELVPRIFDPFFTTKKSARAPASDSVSPTASSATTTARSKSRAKWAKAPASALFCRSTPRKRPPEPIRETLPVARRRRTGSM